MRWNRRRTLVATGAAATGLLVYGTTPGAAVADPGGDAPERLERAVTLDGTLEHLRALQQIADVNGGERAAGSTGYAASAGYVMGQLQAAGYQVELQEFEFPFFTENADVVLAQTEPDEVTYVAGEDVATMTYSGSGDVTADVVPVDVTLPPPAEPGSTSGCEPEDFADFPAGAIALLQRGTCTFSDKARNAQEAGAAAVVVFNEGQPGRTELLTGTLGEPMTIPVVGVPFELGRALADAADDGLQLRVATDTTSETRSTFNVLAETPGGRDDNVVMVGAHLDSVPEGAGINDNGSGSAAILEVATELVKQVPEPRNTVRFAWWSAEEFGLLGAEHYVSTLSDAELGDIALYLNFDMVASPNFARFVYDGDDSDAEGAGAGPEGSGAVEDAFEAFFADRGLPTEGTDFTGRSDYGPFIEVGIPAGGLFTGAEELKSEEQAELYGGTAGQAFDPCYHQECDTSRNISNRALEENADAIAHVVAEFALSTESVNDRVRRAAGVGTAAVAGPALARRGHSWSR